jgi:type VII secretion effector (TIGR04197 family)
MSDRFSVDLASIRSAGSHFTEQSQALGTAVSKLRSQLPNPSAMSGHDSQGQAFAARYGPQAEQLEQAMAQMAAGLAGIAEGLRAMADNFERSDAASVMRKG